MYKSKIYLDPVVSPRANMRVFVKRGNNSYVGDVLELKDEFTALVSSLKTGEVEEELVKHLFIPYVTNGRKYNLSLEWRNHLVIDDIDKEYFWFIVGNSKTNRDKAIRVMAYALLENNEMFYSFTTDFEVAKVLVESNIIQWTVL